ncbi:expressed unknown protein [Seminavis robusta]|uniref:Uncharacterized protein n=1 Tax=Seminavis robusta TaxID=568900 RepID=A0A9N8HS65_9STRA|nr:expressed unknown protein [Seminavis robusta]|eukprot:Sro1403_g269640.1 n/a (363) ;mRNA; r:5098-6186
MPSQRDKKKKKFGFNATAKSTEHQRGDVVYELVETMSVVKLEQLIADSVGCDRRNAALIILRDMAFAFGVESTGTEHWPKSHEAFRLVVDFIYQIRDEMTQKPSFRAAVKCYKEWGVWWSSDGKHIWDLERVIHILSLLDFKEPQLETDDLEEEANGSLWQLDELLLVPKTIMPKLPEIVEVVAIAGKHSGASTNHILQMAQLRLAKDQNPDAFGQSIPGLECRHVNGQVRYFLSEEEGYDDPILTGHLRKSSYQVAFRVLQRMVYLCEWRTWPTNLQCTTLALKVCDCNTSKHQELLDIWNSLGVCRIPKRAATSTDPSWNHDRIQQLLSNSQVARHLQMSVTSILRNLPTLSSSSLEDHS